jgi:hypothetical protein
MYYISLSSLSLDLDKLLGKGFSGLLLAFDQVGVFEEPAFNIYLKKKNSLHNNKFDLFTTY